MADFVSLALDSMVIGAGIFALSFLILIGLWSGVIRMLFSFMGKTKFYFVPQTLKELFLSVAFIFILISVAIAVLFTDRTLLTGEFFKLWEVLIIFASANIVVRIVLTGLDAHSRRIKDRSGIYRSVGLLKGTLGLLLYLIALILSINVLSAEVGQVVTLIGLFVVVLLFVASFDQVKSIMAGLQLGDYYVDQGKMISIDGHTGFVDSVHGRSTIIKRLDGKTVIIPNYHFFRKTFVLDTDDLSEMTLLAEIDCKNAGRCREKISGISSKVAIGLKDIPEEFKPKVFHDSVREGRHVFSITVRINPESDVRRIMDSFCSDLSSEFKESLISVSLRE